MSFVIEPRYCPSCGFHLTRIGPEGDLVLSDRTFECRGCRRRVAVHVSWRRDGPQGHYVVTGWILRNLRGDELADAAGTTELAAAATARPPAPEPVRRRGWLRGALDELATVDARPRLLV